MMSEQFTIVGEEYVGYMQGNAYIISDGECKFSLWERKEDAQKVCDYLNEQLQKKLECCEYEHFLNELDEINEKIDKGDLSDFNPLKEDKPLNNYNPLKEKLYYWQCKYYRRDYEQKMDMCTRCNYGGLLNYCLKDKCDKMVKSDYEVNITESESGVSISLKKGVDKR